MKGNRHSLCLHVKVSDVKAAINAEIAHTAELIEELEKFSEHADKHLKGRVRKFFDKHNYNLEIKLQKKLDALIHWAGIMACYAENIAVTLNQSDARFFNISGFNK